MSVVTRMDSFSGVRSGLYTELCNILDHVKTDLNSCSLRTYKCLNIPLYDQLNLTPKGTLPPKGASYTFLRRFDSLCDFFLQSERDF